MANGKEHCSEIFHFKNGVWGCVCLCTETNSLHFLSFSSSFSFIGDPKVNKTFKEFQIHRTFFPNLHLQFATVCDITYLLNINELIEIFAIRVSFLFYHSSLTFSLSSFFKKKKKNGSVADIHLMMI